jgi:hypothetical protein
MNHLSIINTLKSAWTALEGTKMPIWSIAVLFILITATLEWVTNWIIHFDSQQHHYWVNHIIIPVITNFCVAVFYGGGIMVAIHHKRKTIINLKTGYQYLHRFWPAAAAMVIIGFLSNLMTIFINIPAIAQKIGQRLAYFDLTSTLFSLIVESIFILSIPLIMDKNQDTKTALLHSLKITKPHVIQIFFLLLLTYLGLFLSALPMIIGVSFNHPTLLTIGTFFFVAAMIWLLPFLFLVTGEIYHQLVDKAKNPA